jgi:hypothetical protein
MRKSWPIIVISILIVIVLGREVIKTRDELSITPVQVVQDPNFQVGDRASLPIEPTGQLGRNFNDDANKEMSASSDLSNSESIVDEGDDVPALFKQSAGDPIEDDSDAVSVTSANLDIVSQTESIQTDNFAQTAGNHRPLMIRWSNWRSEFGPALVYAREWDLEGMLRLQGPFEKMLMVTSYAETERLMIRADELRAAGVTIVGLNTEEGPEMTPHEEMDTLDIPDPSINVVARVARLATEHGFEVIWGPARLNADSVSDAAIGTMLEAGMSGLALQEQKFIEVQPAQLRLAEVNRTRERYLRLAQEQAVEEFTVHVQIMPQRCPDLNNCVDFVVGLEEIPVDSIAIWSNGPIPLGFISAIRHY